MSRKIYLNYILTNNGHYDTIKQYRNVYIDLLISGEHNTYKLYVLNGEIQHTISQHKLNRDGLMFIKGEPRRR